MMSGLRVGIVGAGHISTSHINGWKKARGAGVRAITDIDPALAQSRARRHGIPTVAETLDHLLPMCDVVDICTPPHTHAQIILAAAAAGRHVLVEKPVVTDVEDWRRIRAAVEAAGVQLAVVHNIKFSRALQEARRWLDRGRIGKVIRLQRDFLTHPSHDRMLAVQGHWSHSLPGGRWFETLPHELYLIHWLVGALELDVVTALATGASLAGIPADEVALSFRGDGVVATVHYSAHCELNRRTLEIVGTRGRIEIDLLSDSASLSLARDHRWRRAFSAARLDALQRVLGWPRDRAGYFLDRLRGLTPHARLISSFTESLTRGAPAPVPLDEIEYVVEMADAVGKAIEARIETSGP
jgi:predicted dehydrogenase